MADSGTVFTIQRTAIPTHCKCIARQGFPCDVQGSYQCKIDSTAALSRTVSGKPVKKDDGVMNSYAVVCKQPAMPKILPTQESS